MTPATVTHTRRSNGSQLLPERLAPVRRDHRFLWLPERYLRSVFFVILSVLALAAPIVLHFLKRPLLDADAVLYRRSREGKPAEIFQAIAELFYPHGTASYHNLNDSIARLVHETHRYGRELKGLAFIHGDPEGLFHATTLAGELDRAAEQLDLRVYLECNIRKVRALLCLTATAEELAQEHDQLCPQAPSPLPANCPGDRGAGLSIETVAKLERESQDDGDAVPRYALRGLDGVATHPAPDVSEVSSKTLHKHLSWKRTELIRLAASLSDSSNSGDRKASTGDSEEGSTNAVLLARSRDVELLATTIRDSSSIVSIILACLAAAFWYRMWAGRRYALGRGRWRAQLVVYVFLVLQIYNVVLIGAYEQEPQNAVEQSLVAKTSFLIEAYKTATQEIHHRLEQEQHFYILKFTMIGSLLAVFFRFLLSSDGETKADVDADATETPARSQDVEGCETQSETREPTAARGRQASRWSHLRRGWGAKDAIDRLRESKIAAFFFWAAVVINCIIDTRLRYNAVICSALGKWIRTLEGTIEEHGLNGWETFFDQQAPISSSPLMQIAPTLLTTIVFVLTVVLFVAKERASISLRGNVQDDLRQVNLVFGSISFLVMAFSGLGRPSMPWAWLGPVVGWVAAGIALLFLGPKGVYGRVFRRDEITDDLLGYAFPFHYFDLDKRLLLIRRQGRHSMSRAFAVVEWLGQRLLLMWLVLPWTGIRLLSYLPIPGLRRRLVEVVHRSLGVELIHLEINNDPPLGQFLSNLHDYPDEESPAWCWSLLYLKSADDGIERLKGVGSRQLGEKSESATLAREWLRRRLDFIAIDSSTSDEFRFRVRRPSALLIGGGDGQGYVECANVFYCRVHDFYDEHNPWILFIAVVDTWDEAGGHRGKDQRKRWDVVVLSAKDGDTHRLGVAGRWLGEIVPAAGQSAEGVGSRIVA